MKSAVLLEEFSRIGGGQNVAKAILRVTRDQYRFDLVTDRVHDNLNALLFEKIIETRYMYYDGISFPKLLSGIIKLSADLKQNRGYIDSHDLSINNHPNIFLLNASINIIHEPFLGKNFIGRLFSKKFIEELIRLSGVYSIYSEALFVLAGRYIRERIENECKFLEIKPKLITINYPVEYPGNIDFHRKKKYVLTFGRINPDKNLEAVMDIAARSDKTFVIAGAVNGDSVEYVKKLTLLKPDNVTIISNPSKEKKVELLSEATVFLHAKRSESYGLSVAEGIGYGCIPVVPKDGGPWEDIIEHGKYGYGYQTVNEASTIINDILSEDISRYREIYDSRDRFSFASFRDSLWELIESLGS